METNAVTQVLTLNNIAAWTKKELSEFAIASVAEVADNGEDTLKLLSLAAKLEHFSGEVKQAAKERGITDLAKFGKGGAAIAGVKLVLKETGVKYDYSKDQGWSLRNERLTAAQLELTSWQDFLKSLPPWGMQVEDPETLEVYHAYRPLKLAKESIQATIL